MRIRSIQELPEHLRKQVSEAAAATPKRPNKYGAKRKDVNGITFASAWQAQRYEELLNMERCGLVDDLSVEVAFALDVQAPDGKVVRIGAYVADAVYWRGGKMIVEDAKSAPTRRHPLYVWKRSHFEAQYGLRIIEVERNKPRSGVEA